MELGTRESSLAFWNRKQQTEDAFSCKVNTGSQESDLFR